MSSTELQTIVTDLRGSIDNLARRIDQEVGDVAALERERDALRARVAELEAGGPPPPPPPPDPDSDPPPPPPPPPPTGARPSRQSIIDGAGPKTALTPSGSITVTTDGAVIEGLDISGTIDVKANNVTVRNVRARGYASTNVIRLHPGFHHLLVEDAEVVALASPTDPTKGPVGAIGGNGAKHMTVRRTEVSGYADGIKLENGTPEDPSIYELNYVHMSKPAGSAKHLDGMQGSMDSYVTVRHNVIDADIGKGGNAAVFMQAWNGAKCEHIYSNTVHGNYLRGGNYTVYLEGGKDQCGGDTGQWVHDYRLTDNVFEGGYRYGHVRFGNKAETTISGNVDQDGQPVT